MGRILLQATEGVSRIRTPCPNFNSSRKKFMGGPGMPKLKNRFWHPMAL